MKRNVKPLGRTIHVVDQKAQVFKDRRTRRVRTRSAQRQQAIAESV